MALCFSARDDLLVAGYESGLLELWQHNTVVGRRQVKLRTALEEGFILNTRVFLCLCNHMMRLFVCVRLQTAPSQRSAPCRTASLLSAT